MYDAVLTRAILDRLGDFVRDVVNHPGKGLLVAAGFVLFLWWLTRK